MTLTPPADARETVEVAPGIHIPANRAAEFQAFAACNPHIAQAVADMHTVLTQVAPGIYVERQHVAVWIERVENDPVYCSAMDCLMDRLAANEAAVVLMPAAPLTHPVRRHSVHSFALAYGVEH